MSMTSDYEEDLDDFPEENKDRPAESLVGAYRAESTDQWTAGSGITTKVPPLFDGPRSWFKYEELIDDWLDLTVLEAEERGPALKNRLVGEYKGLLDREPLKAADGGQPLQRYVEASLHQRSSECVPLEILSVHPSKKRKRRDGQVDGQNFIALENLEGFLVLPMSALSEEQRQHQYVADVTLENVERQRRSAEVLDSTQETRDRCYDT